MRVVHEHQGDIVAFKPTPFLPLSGDAFEPEDVFIPVSRSHHVAFGASEPVLPGAYQLPLNALSNAMTDLPDLVIAHYERHATAWDRDRQTAGWNDKIWHDRFIACLLYTSPSPRDPKTSRMPSSA